MITDNLSNAERYYALHPLFEKAFDYLRGLDFEAALPCKADIAGEHLKANIVESKMKPQPEAQLEIHRKYIDIQVPISKGETFGWKSTSSLQSPAEEFNVAEDIGFYRDEPTTYIAAQPGEFVIFFPEDAHAPLIGEGEIVKVILKIAIL